jgi:RimJ/RimL family protein N-acetyltransferase
LFNIRTADTKDTELLQALAREIWVTHYTGILTAGQIEYMLNKMYSLSTIEQEINSGIIWNIIIVDGEPVGFISFTPSDKEIKLNKLYILTDYHGKAYGQKALSYVVDYARAHSIPKVYLTVNKKNHKAIKAYERAGFSLIRQEITDIGNGYVMDDFVYSFIL